MDDERRDLARAADADPRPGSADARYLGFRVGGVYYALPLTAVQEIRRLQPVTEVPRAAAHVLGVILAGGQVLTVIDLRRRLGARTPVLPAPGPKARILRIGTPEEDFGLLVDEVTRIHRVGEDRIERAQELPGRYGPHVAGVVRPDPAGASGDEDLLVLLDLPALLTG